MKNRTYKGEFKDWSEVVGSYGGKCPTAEPRYVYADYETPSYEGYSTVIVSSNGRTFSVVEGSHCSCYGLEGQWEPTVHNRTDLKKMMDAKYGFFEAERDAMTKWLAHIAR